MKGKTGGGISCSGGDPRDDLGVGEFAFGPSIMQMIAGLIAFGFGVLTIATVWGVREIHECWKKRWEAEDALAELTATPNRGSYIPE